MHQVRAGTALSPSRHRSGRGGPGVRVTRADRPLNWARANRRRDVKVSERHGEQSIGFGARPPLRAISANGARPAAIGAFQLAAHPYQHDCVPFFPQSRSGRAGPSLSRAHAKGSACHWMTATAGTGDAAASTAASPCVAMRSPCGTFFGGRLQRTLTRTNAHRTRRNAQEREFSFWKRTLMPTSRRAIRVLVLT